MMSQTKWQMVWLAAIGPIYLLPAMLILVMCILQKAFYKNVRTTNRRLTENHQGDLR